MLAFDAALEGDMQRLKRTGIAGGRLFSTTRGGTGTVATTVVGKPVVLDCSSPPAYVDTRVAVCWSAGLVPGVRSTLDVRPMLRGGSGEAVQHVFSGPGVVVVQAHEGVRRAPLAGGSSGGSGPGDVLSG